MDLNASGKEFEQYAGDLSFEMADPGAGEIAARKSSGAVRWNGCLGDVVPLGRAGLTSILSARPVSALLPAARRKERATVKIGARNTPRRKRKFAYKPGGSAVNHRRSYFGEMVSGRR